jgi:DNA polymerase-3 subunit epsilon
LPGHLDPSLIDRLPESPGVYVFHGDGDEVLLAATAANLKWRVQNYFRLDLMSARALAISHRIRNISWRVTQGPLGARLQLALLPERALPPRKGRVARALHSWRFAPDAVPCLSPVPLCTQSMATGDELYGAFDSPRKARNAMRRIAATHRLCHSLLGLRESAGVACPGCAATTAGRPANAVRHASPISPERTARCEHFAFRHGPVAARSPFASAATSTSSTNGNTWGPRGLHRTSTPCSKHALRSST